MHQKKTRGEFNFTLHLSPTQSVFSRPLPKARGDHSETRPAGNPPPTHPPPLLHMIDIACHSQHWMHCILLRPGSTVPSSPTHTQAPQTSGLMQGSRWIVTTCFHGTAVRLAPGGGGGRLFIPACQSHHGVSERKKNHVRTSEL